MTTATPSFADTVRVAGDTVNLAQSTACPDKAAVAALTTEQIARMSRRELAEVVRAANLSLLSAETLDRLAMMDRPTLERLAYLARRSCCNQGFGLHESVV